MSTPATPGPATYATELPVASFAFASISEVRCTSEGRYAAAAIPNTAPRTPSANATPYSTSMRSRPSAVAPGTASRISARPTSVQMRIGRRRRRSTHAPATSPTSTGGRYSATRSSPIWPGDAPNIMTAVSGNASGVIWDPSTEMVCPVHSFKKSPCRHRLPAAAGGAPLISGVLVVTDLVVQADQTGVGRSEATRPIELPQVRIEVDVHPVHAALPCHLHRPLHQPRADPAPPQLGVHGGLQ